MTICPVSRKSHEVYTHVTVTLVISTYTAHIYMYMYLQSVACLFVVVVFQAACLLVAAMSVEAGWSWMATQLNHPGTWMVKLIGHPVVGGWLPCRPTREVISWAISWGPMLTGKTFSNTLYLYWLLQVDQAYRRGDIPVAAATFRSRIRRSWWTSRFPTHSPITFSHCS